jgi:trehalose 2-sulfotransferase
VSAQPSGSGPYDLAGAAHDFSGWSGPPRRTLWICTHPRSGSTLLCEALHFAGGFGSPLEYFHRGARPGMARRWGAATLAEYVAAVYRHRTAPDGLLSVKIFWQDVEDLVRELAPDHGARVGRLPDETPAADYRLIAEVLAPLLPNPTLVHLRREDRVRQAVSAVTATQVGRWRMIPGQDGPRTQEPEFDYGRIAGMIGFADYSHSHWRNFFAALGRSPYALSYEDLSTRYEQAMGGLLRHLGSTAPPPPVRMLRQSDAYTEALVLRFLRENELKADIAR